jgi:hypothetical protein
MLSETKKYPGVTLTNDLTPAQLKIAISVRTVPQNHFVYKSHEDVLKSAKRIGAETKDLFSSMLKGLAEYGKIN